MDTYCEIIGNLNVSFIGNSLPLTEDLKHCTQASTTWCCSQTRKKPDTIPSQKIKLSKNNQHYFIDLKVHENPTFYFHMLLYAEVHFPVDILFDRVDPLEYLRHGLHESLAADPGSLRLELGQQFRGGHRLARQVAADGLLCHAAFAGMKHR